jgi:hypothetical protein
MKLNFFPTGSNPLRINRLTVIFSSARKTPTQHRDQTMGKKTTPALQRQKHQKKTSEVCLTTKQHNQPHDQPKVSRKKLLAFTAINRLKRSERKEKGSGVGGS